MDRSNRRVDYKNSYKGTSTPCNDLKVNKKKFSKFLSEMILLRYAFEGVIAKATEFRGKRNLFLRPNVHLADAGRQVSKPFR
jgi:hypothetical protein